MNQLSNTQCFGSSFSILRLPIAVLDIPALTAHAVRRTDIVSVQAAGRGKDFQLPFLLRRPSSEKRPAPCAKMKRNKKL